MFNTYYFLLVKFLNSITKIYQTQHIVNFKTKSLGSFDATESYEILKTLLWRHHSKGLHSSHENVT